jgi:ATP/maltotriose-dependent transcriptional regulator MalT
VKEQRISDHFSDHSADPQQEALHLLDRLRESAETKARMGSVLEILILRALALEAQGDRMHALATLERALVLAAPEGYLSVNTVKRHVYNLCGKLGVQSRTQAIARARTLNFL